MKNYFITYPLADDLIGEKDSIIKNDLGLVYWKGIENSIENLTSIDDIINIPVITHAAIFANKDTHFFITALEKHEDGTFNPIEQEYTIGAAQILEFQNSFIVSIYVDKDNNTFKDNDQIIFYITTFESEEELEIWETQSLK